MYARAGVPGVQVAMRRSCGAIRARFSTSVPPSAQTACDETAGGCGGDGTGLPASVTDGRMQGVLGRIMARKRPDLPAVEQKKRLLVSRSVVESSERPTAVPPRRIFDVGRRPSGKPRFTTPGRFIPAHEGLQMNGIGARSSLGLPSVLILTLPTFLGCASRADTGAADDSGGAAWLRRRRAD